MVRTRSLLLVVGVALLAVLAFPVGAASSFRVKPGVYDPDKTGIVQAEWRPKIGLKDAGNSNHGLYLAKNGLTATNAAAEVSIEGVAGMTVQEFGYDLRKDAYCGAGSPRFNLEASDGFHFIGGCANGTKTQSAESPDWWRVRFDPQNPSQAYPPVAPGATIISLSIIADEQGVSIIDNIDVNGTLAGKPGNA